MNRRLCLILMAVILTGCAANSERNNAGNNLVEAGDFNQAVDAYQSSQIDAPDSPEAYMNMASALSMDGDYEGAVSALHQALKTANPQQAAEAYYNLGNVYYQMGSFGDAVHAYEQALLINPDDEDARYNLELAWGYVLPATPTAVEQKTNPEDSQSNPTATPTPNPAGQDGPTPTPPPIDSPPDLSATPKGLDNSDRGQVDQATPLPREGGPMTIEEAQRILNDAEPDIHTLREYLQEESTPEVQTGRDW